MKQTSEDLSIQTAFREAWELFVKKIGTLFAVTTVTFLAQFGLFIISMIVITSLIVGAGHVDVLHFNADMLQAIPTWVIVATVLSIIASFIASVIVSFVGYVSMYLAVEQKEGSLKTYAKQSLRNIVPLFLSQILVFLLVFGNVFVFFIPAIIAGYFCMFVTQVVIYEHASAIQAIKRSIALVSQNFGSLFVKLIVPFLIQAIIEGFFTSMMKQNPATAMMFQLPHIVLSFVWGYFMFVYSYVLYKHASLTTKDKPSRILTWLTVGAIVGAVIVSLLVYAGISFMRSPKAKEVFSKIAESTKEANSISASESAVVTYKYTPIEAAKLGKDVFLLTNNKRIALGIKPLEEADNLCAYAQRRVDVMDKRGSYDEGQGLFADMRDLKIAPLYFEDNTLLTEFIGQELGKDRTKDDLVDGWISNSGRSDKKPGILSKTFTKGCVMTSASTLVFVVSGPAK